MKRRKRHLIYKYKATKNIKQKIYKKQKMKNQKKVGKGESSFFFFIKLNFSFLETLIMPLIITPQQQEDILKHPQTKKRITRTKKILVWE